MPQDVLIPRREDAWPTQRFACIVGAPRCGTTTLARLLKKHPSVSFSNVKEPHFFSRVDLSDLDDRTLREVVGGQYLDRYFPDIDPQSSLMAEASVSYLYAPERLLPLLKLWPDAKFIIAVRDPLELIPSLHQRLLYQGDETVGDLETAWNLIEQRRLGRKVPRTCLDSRQLLYDEAAMLGKHVGRFFDVLGRDRCEVVVFDDLRADPGAVHDRLLKFLDLKPVPLPRKRKHRERYGFRIGWLQRMLKRPPVARTILAGEVFRQRVTRKPHREPSWLSRKVLDARRALLDWNRVPVAPAEISPAFRRQIRQTLQQDTLLLGKLLDRDLRHWLGGIDEGAGALERAA